ncbi:MULTISPECIES: amidase [Rhizobium]|uniref:amidase n=1 Tax=Rhizobium TaxID=379 RepID=UPI000A1EC0FD|nr:MULTISPECIES: amidase [Rhizobium]ARM90922.1 amidase protein [Rhizobium sp. CIAT894]MBB4299509.1 aspartyl-tRNA(Asn)/glutamyl-tRNA(Gln) amidotransferase subunit A [Rhizobium leguminosarum]MBB4310947.1 aspartyl-tRNA(Asn)/glutamyl-tRNA(Gln) amidotransferase subunit A [Rhizobium leguminosarum]MBB4419941.1 aspartyl-tRNA(Asn)/glutamyl-tRNA(Gln) amidotransferase subunit A [Rhizobium leguminosarum]MBB4435063.1 aspartyl-tRNA(Asn)/glutamyl-tRNA(Gln) amidotransferase subunit A [Rhizobium esperanzae]
MVQSYGSMSIAQLSVLIQSGHTDPVTVIEQILESIASFPDDAVFIEVTSERAIREAKESSKRLRDGRSLGLLEGVPVAWKDLFDLEGTITSAGSKLLRRDHAPAAADAAVVARLALTGMVSTGRVNMSELAFSGLGLNPHFGTPLNPLSRDVDRIPGGSSSGSAVAVAAGLVPVSIGSDTSGSVRIPAAFNGLIGYKASRGRYPMQGIYPLADSLDSLGPLARSVQDAWWIDAAMRGATPSVGAPCPASALEIVIPTNVVFDGAGGDVVKAFELALDRLSVAGAKIVREPIPALTELLDTMAQYGSLVTAEAYAFHEARIIGPDARLIDRRVVKRALAGQKITMPDYVALLAARRRMTGEVEAQIGSRLVAFPTVAHVAPPLEGLEKDEDAFFAMNGKTLRNTSLGSFLDWCGISIPCGTGEAGMPVGFLISGSRGQDETLLSAALGIEGIVRGS